LVKNALDKAREFSWKRQTDELEKAFRIILKREEIRKDNLNQVQRLIEGKF
jgi:hypothetical protein